MSPEEKISNLFLQNEPFRPLFYKLSYPRTLFSFQYRRMFNINFAKDWIRTVDIWYRKRPLNQLSHNHFPNSILYFVKLLKSRHWDISPERSGVFRWRPPRWRRWTPSSRSRRTGWRARPFRTTSAAKSHSWRVQRRRRQTPCTGPRARRGRWPKPRIKITSELTNKNWTSYF